MTSGVGLVGKMPNDFSPSLTVSHSFVLLGDFQHCGLSVRVVHQLCSRARLFCPFPPMLGLKVIVFLRHAEHLRYHSTSNGALAISLLGCFRAVTLQPGGDKCTEFWYWAIVDRETDGRFIASIPDLGDLAAYGDTDKDAVAHVTDLAAERVRAAIDDGQPVPPRRQFREMPSHVRSKEVWRAIIPVEVGRREAWPAPPYHMSP